jgi:hypothetical protein
MKSLGKVGVVVKGVVAWDTKLGEGHGLLANMSRTGAGMAAAKVWHGRSTCSTVVSSCRFSSTSGAAAANDETITCCALGFVSDGTAT